MARLPPQSSLATSERTGRSRFPQSIKNSETQLLPLRFIGIPKLKGKWPSLPRLEDPGGKPPTFSKGVLGRCLLRSIGEIGSSGTPFLQGFEHS